MAPVWLFIESEIEANEGISTEVQRAFPFSDYILLLFYLWHQLLKQAYHEASIPMPDSSHILMMLPSIRSTFAESQYCQVYECFIWYLSSVGIQAHAENRMRAFASRLGDRFTSFSC